MSNRKKKGIILFVLFLFPFVTLFSQTPDATKNFDQNVNGVLKIKAMGEDKGEIVGQGAGFVVKENELVITCYHIVSNAVSVEATNVKGRKIKVEGIVGVDRNLDIAILKIKGKAPALNLGNSDEVKMGDRVFAIGGLELSITEGSVLDLLRYTSSQIVFQSNLAFKEGFSGGPFLNLAGQVVGVTVDLGKELEFFVPINELRPLIASGKITNFKSWQKEDYLKTNQGAFLAGMIYVQQDKPGRARTHLETVVKTDPNNLEAYFGLADVNTKLRSYDSAAAVYKKIIAIDPNKEEAHLGLGSVYLRKRSYLDAIPPLKKVIEINPQNVGAYFQLGKAYEEQKDYEKALEVYKQYIELDVESKSDAYLRIGFCAKELGLSEEAINAYLLALEEKPDNVDIYTKLSEIYQTTTEYDKAADSYEKLAEIDEQHAKFYFGKIVNMFDSTGEYEKAIKAAERIKELDPKSELAVYNIGFLYSKMKEYNKAIESFKKVLAVNPDYELAHYNIGLNYFNLKRYKEAVDAYTKVVQITPDNADAWFIIGVCHMQLKKHEEALEPLKKSIELRPTHGVALFNLAVCYINLKDDYSAKQIYNQLLNIDPGYAQKLKKYIK